MRFSKRPSKSLFWLWFHRDIKKSAAFDDGADIACGTMYNRPLFKTKTYTGVDIDADRVKKGLANHPDARGEVKAIADLVEDRFDFAACVQTIGINQYFKPTDTVPSTKKLADCLKEGGMLLANFGPGSAAHIEEVDAMLRSYFSEVHRYDYGAMSRFTFPVFISAPIAFAMHLLPLLRNGSDKYVYFRCINKLYKSTI